MVTISEIQYKAEELKASIDGFSRTSILVIGDIIMDRYIWGDVSRISPEAPVPVVDVKKETKMLGGAANVLNNIASLGGKAVLCGVVGDDRNGREIIQGIKALDLNGDGIIVEDDRPTSIKTRVVAHSQQVVRFDRENRSTLQAGSIQKILSFIKETRKGLDAIIVADYGKGVVSEKLMKGLRKLVWDTGILLAVDPKTGNFESYKGVDVITPNHHEAGAFCQFEIQDNRALVKAGRHMIQALEARSVLITQGKDGMTLFEQEGRIGHIPTVARKVFDVTGAGDTVISTLCLGMASGMDVKSAAVVSNFAAGIVVGEVGTSVVNAADLKKAITG